MAPCPITALLGKESLPSCPVGVCTGKHLHRLAVRAPFDAAQDMIDLLGCKHSLSAHCVILFNQQTQVLLLSAALHPSITQSVWIFGFALAQVQYLALGFYEVHMCPPLNLSESLWMAVLSLHHAACTFQHPQTGLIQQP